MKSILPIIYIASFAILLIGIGHLAIYKSIIAVFDISTTRMINILRGIFIFGALSFILTNFIIQMGYSQIGSFFYKLSAIWLGTVYFLFLASVLILIVFTISHFWGLSLIFARVIGLILIIMALLVSLYGVLHSYNILTTRYTVRIENLPEEWAGKNIVMFADSHFGSVRNINFGQKLITKIENENPEIVLIAGDYYDGPPANDEAIANLVSNLKTERGIIFAPGNHEDYGNISNYKKFLLDAGVEFLDNKTINIGGLQIAGINYNTGSNNDTLTRTLNDLELKDDLPKILIKHAPTNLLAVEEARFDLVVSGHVHNGQIWPGPWLTKKIYKEFSYGMNLLNKMTVITTSGVGTWGPPQRVGTNSEIVVITLKKE